MTPDCEVVCYVDEHGDLVHADTKVRIRKATESEKQASKDSEYEGRFQAIVPEQRFRNALKRRAAGRRWLETHPKMGSVWV